jgi:hypothetical protein
MASGHEVDMRTLVRSSTDDDGEPNLELWLSINDDNPPEPEPQPPS